MDEKSPDKLGFKGRMLIFTALETYGCECAFAAGVSPRT